MPIDLQRYNLYHKHLRPDEQQYANPHGSWGSNPYNIINDLKSKAIAENPNYNYYGRSIQDLLVDMLEMRGHAANKAANQKDTANHTNALRQLEQNPASKASRFLNQEKSRVNSLPHQVYQGQQIADKSPLTLRAEQLQSKYANKTPYQRQMNELMSRQDKIQGLTDQNKGDIGQFLGEYKGRYQDKSLGFLNRLFRQPYNEEDKQRFLGRSQKQLGKNDALHQEELNNFSQILAQDQKMSNSQKINTLRQLSSMHSEDRNKLMSALTMGGNQQTAIANMSLESKQKNFQNQLAQPYRELGLLEQELAPHQKHNQAQRQDMINRREHAMRRKAGLEEQGYDIGEYQSPINHEHNAPTTSIGQILAAYGVHNQDDASENWRRSGVNPFPSMNVANTPNELQEAQNGLLNLKFRKSPELKNAVGNMVGTENGDVNKITGSALSNIRERTAYEDKNSRKVMKHKLRMIGNRFAGRGEYNSPAHIRAVEEEAARSNAFEGGRRHKDILSSLTNQSQVNQHENKHAMVHAQYMALLNQMQNDQKLQEPLAKHKRGVNQFNVAQDVLDNEYVNKLFAHDFNWPSLRNQIAGQGFNTKLNRQNTVSK